MAVRSGFFNSVNGDRKYDAKRFAEYFSSFIGNGVFPNPSTNLQVMANNDMTVTVKAGKAWIDGYILINDDDYILNIDVADGALNRIDRIVARYDVVDREIRIEVKKGTFASNPIAPVLQRDADAYELALAEIRINKGAVRITQAGITDTRLSKELCGIVHGLVDQVDTEVLFQDYLSWINQKKDEFNTNLIDYTALKQGEIDDIISDFQDNFDAWFSTIQNILNENVSGNLLDMINQNTVTINELKDEIETILPNKADLDETRNVPVEQLENVQYLKDWYGRGVTKYDARSIRSILKLGGIDFNTFDYYVFNGNNWNPRPEGVIGGDLDATFYTTEGSGSVVAMTNRTIRVNTDNIAIATVSIKHNTPIDLTNVDYIEFECSRETNATSVGTRVGVQKKFSSDILFDKYISVPTSRSKIVLDVRELEGEYFIKYCVTNANSTSMGWLYMYGINIKYNGNSSKCRKVGDGIELKNSELEGVMHVDPIEIPSGFIDWYNLNSLITTPPNTYVRFDIYDNNGLLLKGDVKQGDILQLVNPIIKPTITMQRANLATPSPIFKWMEIGYRGAGTGVWSKIAEIVLEQDTVQLDVDIPEGFDEVYIKLSNFGHTHTSTSTPSLKFNNDDTSSYSHSMLYKTITSVESVTADTVRVTAGRTLSASTLHDIVMRIYGVPQDRRVVGEITSYGSGYTSILYGGFMYRKVDRIHTINLFFTNGSICLGSSIEVWGR